MAPRTRSKSVPAREEAEAKNATAISTTSPTQDHDSEEIPDRPSKRRRITHEMRVQHFATRTDASRQAVLQTNELLEGILSFLPPNQLFADQRVCKQWRDVIVSCPELQKKMFLRVDEVPRQIWGFKIDYSHPDPSRHFELRRFDSRPPSLLWRRVTPVILSPHLKIVTYDDDPDRKDSVTYYLPQSLPIGKYSSILDTYFCNPPCCTFAFGFDFNFEPPIPGYGRLIVHIVQFQTGKALKVGEALDRAMAIPTDAELFNENVFDKSAKSKRYRNVTAAQIVNKLQRVYGCTAIICDTSLMMLDNVFIPKERQPEVDAAHSAWNNA